MNRSDAPQSFWNHLDELIRRARFSLIALVFFTIGGYFFVDQILAFLAQASGGFVFTRPTEAFIARLKIAFSIGFLAAVPIILYQAWRFVATALTWPERRITLLFLPLSYALFCLGALCACFVVAPAAINFFLSFATPDLRPMISINAYLGFFIYLTLAFGLLFELPLIVYFLVLLGVATPESLAYYRRHVLLGLAIAAAVLTPGPDPFSQLALLLPTYILYEFSIIFVRWQFGHRELAAQVNRANCGGHMKHYLHVTLAGILLTQANPCVYAQDNFRKHRQSMYDFDGARPARSSAGAVPMFGFAGEDAPGGDVKDPLPSNDAKKKDESDAQASYEAQKQQVRPPDVKEQEKNVAKPEANMLDKFAEALPWVLASAIGGLIGFLLVKVVTTAVEGGPLLTYSLILGGLVLAVAIFLLVYYLVIKKKEEDKQEQPTQPAPAKEPAAKK